MKVTLCDKNGVHQLGSDGHIHVDGRYSIPRVTDTVRDYRERFKKNFPHKYELWTHFRIEGRPRLYKIGSLVTD